VSRLYLFDDAVAAGWEPFSSTRPVGELVFGGCSFRERAELVTGATCAGHIAPHLSGLDEPDSPPVVSADAVDRDGLRIWLNARFVPDWNGRIEAGSGEAVLLAGGGPVGWISPPGTPGPQRAFLDGSYAAASDEVATVRIGGHLLDGFWELVTRHGDQLGSDMRRLAGDDVSTVDAGVTVLGDSGLRIGQHVTIEPNVVIDCTAGPVWLEDHVTLRAFTRLAGPTRIGPGSTLLGGTFDAVTVGPRCRLRGELESSVILGYSNKAHDGFIGHAVIGRWVNLGALTTNSDLKNNYGTVRVATAAGEIDTGSMKVGCFLGDHVKTAIGTMLNTGTVIGPGSNIFGATPAKHVPPFSWGGGDDAVHAFDRFLETAETAMRRRDVPLTPGVRAVLERAFAASRGGQ
jgi:UDP-N-acetylglucosamine diphosphorylase/glucosamine-1-phosphate N-acetyltransferase